jgi:hypothetical protein
MAVVNERFAAEFVSPSDAIDHEISIGKSARWKIIGVVKGMDYMTDTMDTAHSNQIFVPAHVGIRSHFSVVEFTTVNDASSHRFEIVAEYWDHCGILFRTSLQETVLSKIASWILTHLLLRLARGAFNIAVANFFFCSILHTI